MDLLFYSQHSLPYPEAWLSKCIMIEVREWSVKVYLETFSIRTPEVDVTNPGHLIPAVNNAISLFYDYPASFTLFFRFALAS